jgi:DNA-binding LacI/PurR family transcriptional regulator
MDALNAVSIGYNRDMSMPTSADVASLPDERRADTMSATQVLKKLEQLHGSLQVGQQFPSYRELTRRLNASERAVARALDELSRQGKIVKRLGRGGSVVADPGHAVHRNGNTPYAEPGECTLAPVASDSRTVIAITEPDGNIFDQAMQLLMKQAKSAKLAVACLLVNHSEAAQFAVPSVAEGPRRYLVFRRENLPLAERLREAGHHVVLIGTPFTDVTPEVPVVAGDQEHGGYLAMKHLLELGHRRIAIHKLEDSAFDYSYSRDYVKVPRFVGYQHALDEAREEGRDIQLRFLGAEYGGEFHGQVAEWGRNPDKVRDYFSSPDAPTAIASWNDDMAIRLLSQLQRAGIRVPEDVSLVGYDNQARGAWMHPSLTTVDGVVDQQIRTALRLLTQPQAPAKSHSVVVLPALVPRESTAPPQT